MLVALGLVVSLVGCSADEHVELDLPSQSDGAFPDDTTAQLKAAVDFAVAATGSTGAIIGVWAPWSGSWVSGVGTQRPGAGAKVTTDMQFRAGRVTRAMTCDVLYGVVADGIVKLDDSVSTYVAGVPQESAVTLRQLCDGTSGIGSFAPQLHSLFMTNPTRVWDPRELAGYGLGEPRTTEPGAAYVDSDAGYVLLGLALERATGRNGGGAHPAVRGGSARPDGHAAPFASCAEAG